jgi:hypothetical protein
VRSHCPGLNAHQRGCRGVACTPRWTNRYLFSDLALSYTPLKRNNPPNIVQSRQSSLNTRLSSSRPEHLRRSRSTRPNDRVKVLGTSLFGPKKLLPTQNKRVLSGGKVCKRIECVGLLPGLEWITPGWIKANALARWKHYQRNGTHSFHRGCYQASPHVRNPE